MHFHFRQETYEVKLTKGFFSLCLFFFMVCCILGTWQIYRYHYKKALVFNHEQRLKMLPKPFMLAFGSLTDLQFQPIAADGSYINAMTLLVQNRFHQGQLGYEVLTPLQIKGDKKLLLVDRGWIQKPKDQLLPEIDKALGEQHITGYIKLLNEYQFILGKNILEPSKSPLVIQKIDIKELNQITQQVFYPFILRLNASQPNGFIRDWVITSMVPERHMVYAVQWFAMAIVLCIAYFCFCTERVKKS
jgi:surfeit locus 1 family protein